MATNPGPGVTAEQARDLIREGALLIDVREPSEWDAGHVPGARHIPLGQLPDEAESVPDGRRVVVVCRSGGRSARATAYLVSTGKDAVNLEGGMQAWEAAGLPIEDDEGNPGSVA